jgi:hypothetical protein
MDDQLILVAGCVVTFIFLGGVYGVLIGFFKNTSHTETSIEVED